MNNKEGLLEVLTNTRQRARFLVTSLTDGQLKVPYHSGVNPPVWELGHCAFFYEYFILKALDQAPSYDPAMDDIWDSFQLDHRDRWLDAIFPGLEDTLRYADTIWENIRTRITSKDLPATTLYLCKYAIFHQNMHIESKIWCRQTIGYPPPAWPKELHSETPVQRAPETATRADNGGDADIPAGRYLIGMPATAATNDFAALDFAFDNEKPRFTMEMGSFAISKQLVSNREFLAFVEDDGYRRPEFWSQGGRRWLRLATEQPAGLEDTLGQGSLAQDSLAQDRGPPLHPAYWRRSAEHGSNEASAAKATGGGWQERFFDQWLPLDPDLPVIHISFWEAEAWCRWAGRRLPTEYEWEVAALGNQPGKPFRRLPWGNGMQPASADLDGIHLARLPVSALPAGDSPFGCRQMIGTVWEWTADQFFPYDGFCKDMYPFMSTLQFGDHKTTRGGSCATSSILIRGTYRQAYLPGRTDVFTGFRTCAL